MHILAKFGEKKFIRPLFIELIEGKKGQNPVLSEKVKILQVFCRNFWTDWAILIWKKSHSTQFLLYLDMYLSLGQGTNSKNGFKCIFRSVTESGNRGKRNGCFIEDVDGNTLSKIRKKNQIRWDREFEFRAIIYGPSVIKKNVCIIIREVPIREADMQTCVYIDAWS